MIKKNNQWFANEPNHFLGWDITVQYFDHSSECFIVEAVNRGTKEKRLVKATEDAIPLQTLERINRRK